MDLALARLLKARELTAGLVPMALGRVLPYR